MEWVETTGRTVAEALDRALDQLGVDEQEAEVQVLDEPQKGLFGRLRVEARVRARVRPVRPRPKAERRDRRRRGDRDRDRDGRKGRERNGAKSGGRSGGKAPAKTATGTRRSSSDGEDNGAKSGAGISSESAGNGSEAGTSGGEQTAEAAQRKRRRRRRGGQAKKQGAAVENANQDTTTGTRTETDVATADAEIDVEAQRQAVESFLVGLLAAFGRPEAKVTVIIDEDTTVDAKVDGEGLGLLVGPKGHTLQAVHELVRSMVQRQFVGEAHARIRVDVAGYRQRRREALERFTHTVAEEVLASGRAKVLDPMGASDRKVVHDVINELDGVSTVSEGVEPDRRVIIQPG